jgi:adenylosuccinate synthase
MPVTVLVGCQWGDEGKGKIADTLSRGMDWVARYGGGHNAGHTVCLGRRSIVLHLIPCGILQKRPRCIIGHGTVVDPEYLVREMDALAERGVPLDGRLFLSETAHLVLPYHRWLETLEGQDTRIGTTRLGIGPAYQDKAGRMGIRVLELMDPARFRRRMEEQIERLAVRYRSAGQDPPRPLEVALAEWTERQGELARRLRPCVADTVELLHGALARGERILCEGAQGTFLDLDLGTYPYVTSSSTTAGGAATGLGLPPSALRRVVGVCKAYATRVGEGPFPTELTGPEGNSLRDKGAEFGATTGRPRRVGWLDLAQLRQAVRINGVTALCLTKLDILSGMSPLRLGRGYRTPEGARAIPPSDTDALALCRPEYDEVAGWSEPLSHIRRFSDLPGPARDYVRRIETEVGCRVQLVSVGSSRSAVVPVPSAGSAPSV